MGAATGGVVGRAVVSLLILLATSAYAGVPPPPECSGPTGTIILPVGTPFTPTLTGTGTGTMTVHDNGTLPPGATLAPPDGTAGADPFDVVFSFTPTIANAGNTYNVSISFEDLFGSPGFCDFSIEVPAVATTTTTSTTSTSTTDTTVTTSTTETTTTTGTTTTTVLSLCGNSEIDPGEECDPPNGEVCNNLVDDDGDMLVDCVDPDCEPLSAETCGADCMLVEPCQPIEKDPARIRFEDEGDDAFWIHGRFALQSGMDPSAEGFGVSLSNANGVIYRATIDAGQFERANGRYVFRDPDVRRGAAPLADGLYTAGVRVRRIRGVEYLVFRLRAYGDFSAAIDPRMTTVIVVGNDVGSLTADWTATRDGWRLNQRDY